MKDQNDEQITNHQDVNQPNQEINIEDNIQKNNKQISEQNKQEDEKGLMIIQANNYELQKGQLNFKIQDAQFGRKCCCCKGPVGVPIVDNFHVKISNADKIEIKKFVFLYNPRSSNGECLTNVNKIVIFCQKNGINYQTIESKSLQHFKEVVGNYDYVQKENILFICGGDGSLHNAINTIAENNKINVSLGVIPLGSANDFAKCINFLKAQFLQRFEQISRSPNLKRIDIIQAKLIDLKGDSQIKYIQSSFGYGYPGRVNEVANRKFQCFKGLRYKVSALQAVFQFKDDIITLEIDNKLILNNQAVKFIMAFNSQFGGAMRLAPYSQVDDGLIDLMIMRINSRCQFLKIFDAAQQDGLAIYQNGVEYYRGSTIKIIGQELHTLELDGETFYAKDVELSIKSDLIKIVC